MKALYQNFSMDAPETVEIVQWLWVGFAHNGTIRAIIIRNNKFQVAKIDYLEPCLD